MSTFRFMHVADTHIGASQVHGDEENGLNFRITDFREAWTRLCETAVEAEVDAVVFAGDGFRDAKPNPTELAAFRAGLDILCRADIVTVGIVGNHDRPRNEAATNALQIFHGYRKLVSIVSRPMVIQEWQNFPAIACLPWPSRAQLAAGHPDFEKMSVDEQNDLMRELLLQTLRALDAEAEAASHDLGSILVAHGTIAGSTIGAESSTHFLREAVLPLNQLCGLGFRYQAFGHLHKAQALAEHIRYSGSVERIDFAEADEDKGAWIGQIIPGGIQDVVWVSSHPRPFVDIDLTVVIERGGLDEWAAGLDLTNMLANDLTAGCRGAVVRVSYTVTPEQARTVDHGAIRRTLYAAGASKVHGPVATLLRSVTDNSYRVTEETSILDGWQEYALLQGIDGPQLARLTKKVCDALEMVGVRA